MTYVHYGFVSHKSTSWSDNGLMPSGHKSFTWPIVDPYKPQWVKSQQLVWILHVNILSTSVTLKVKVDTILFLLNSSSPKGSFTVNAQGLTFTVETLYSTIHYSKYFIELNFDKSTQYVALWTHKRHSIPRPFGRAMECLLWVLQQKLTVL